MKRFIRKNYFKIKSFIISTIKKEKIVYVHGKDIPPACEVIFFDGGEEYR